jgi:hypothetical protein
MGIAQIGEMEDENRRLKQMVADVPPDGESSDLTSEAVQH